MDTRLLRLSWRLPDFQDVRAWSAPDGTEVRVIPANCSMSETTEVVYRVPGIAGWFIVRPNVASQREQFRWFADRLARHGRLLDDEPTGGSCGAEDEDFDGEDYSEEALIAALEALRDDPAPEAPDEPAVEEDMDFDAASILYVSDRAEIDIGWLTEKPREDTDDG